MALIEKYHVVAAFYPVHAGVEIIEGQLVALNVSGEAIPATGALGEVVLGVAGDTKSTTTSGTPDTNQAWIGASNVQNQFQNRVSDAFDETKASGLITVYQSGGMFSTNQYVAAPLAGWAVNAPVYSSATATFTTTPVNALSMVVGYVTKVPAAFDSGVPGIDLANGSMTLGNYMEFKMII